MGRCFGLSVGLLLVIDVARAAEVPLTPLATGAAVSSQYPDSGASDGNDFLFVWTDSSGYQRRATRVTRDGVMLDRIGIPLPNLWSRNSVVWTGNSYLIVWGIGYPSEVWGLRIDRDGKIVDGPRILKNEAYPTSVISNGSEVVIAYHTHSAPYGDFSRRALFLDANAHPLADVELDAPATSGGATSVAWNGSHWAAVWAHTVLDDPNYSVQGLRFNAAGRIDAAPRTLREDTSTEFVPTPAIASDGDGFLMVLGNSVMQTAWPISADLGTVGTGQVLPILNYELLPQLNYSSPMVWTGSSYVLFGHNGDAIQAVQLNHDGTTVRADVIEDAGETGLVGSPVAATNGSDFLVAWTGRSLSDPVAPETDVFATMVSASTFDPRSRTLLSVDTLQQRRPIVASGGTSLLALWREGSGVYAKRLSIDGASLDAAPVRLTERGTPSGVLFNGTHYIVLWEQPNGQPYSQDLFTARIPRDGPLRFDGGARLPDAHLRASASNAMATLLVWYSGDGFHAGRLRGDGTLLDTAPLAIENLEWTGSFALAASDGDFLMAWEEYGPEPYYTTPPLHTVKVRAARLSPELVVRDGSGFDVAASTPQEGEPAVTWNGETWLVVWVSSRGFPSPDQIRGRTVARDGSLDGEYAGTVIVDGGRKPAVAWDGTRYFLAWQTSNAWGAPPLQAMVRTAWLPKLGGSVLSEKPLTLGYPDVSVSVIGTGRVATAYTRTVTDAALGDVSRAFVNPVTHLPRRHAAR